MPQVRRLMLAAGTAASLVGCGLAAPPAIFKSQEVWEARLQRHAPVGSSGQAAESYLRSQGVDVVRLDGVHWEDIFECSDDALQFRDPAGGQTPLTSWYVLGVVCLDADNQVAAHHVTAYHDGI